MSSLKLNSILIRRNRSEKIAEPETRLLYTIAMGAIAVGMALVAKTGISILNRGKRTPQSTGGWEDLETDK